MNAFISNISQGEQNYYSKVNQILGIQSILNISRTKQEKLNFSNEQMFDFCRFNSSLSFSPYLTDKIRGYRELQTGNTCLHVAGQFSNNNMINYIVKNKILNPNQLNNSKDTPLIHTLKTSTHQQFQKTALLLTKYSDLSIKDGSGKHSYQVDMPIYTKSRVRILQFIREQFYSRLRSK